MLLRPWAQRSPRAVLVLSGTQRVRGRVLSAVGHGHHASGWSPRFVPCCQGRAREARRRHGWGARALPRGHARECRAHMPPACPFLLETPQPQRQFTMREMSLAVLLCVLPVLLSCRQLRPGSGAHLQSHGRDEPGSGKVDRGTDGHAPRLAQPPVPRPSPQGPPAALPSRLRRRLSSPSPGALHRTKRRGGAETVRDERHGSDRCDRSERII